MNAPSSASCAPPTPAELTRLRLWLSLLALLGIVGLALLPRPARAETATLLNVSYDVSRELYKAVNPVFAADWQRRGGAAVQIRQSHGGSTTQTGAVIAGLPADVVTLNQAADLEKLAAKGLVAADWRLRFPHGAAPYSSTIVFLVRQGNPKRIRDWQDLVAPGVQVLLANPKVSGNGRYAYLAAWGSVTTRGGSEAQAQAFVGQLLAHVPVFDGGGRGATTTFTQRGIGDVLLTFESEAALIREELGAGHFEQVAPPVSIEAPAPVAVVEPVARQHGTQALAKAYLDFLFTPAAQTLIARQHLRPVDPAVWQQHAHDFADIRLFSVEQQLGGWSAVQQRHFADGALYDQLSTAHSR